MLLSIFFSSKNLLDFEDLNYTIEVNYYSLELYRENKGNNILLTRMKMCF